MYHASSTSFRTGPERIELRSHDRLTLRCPVRVRIGSRQYAAYLENISERGAKVRTITPILQGGKVQLTLPDLPGLDGESSWFEGNGVGICFKPSRRSAALRDWIERRVSSSQDT
jgi:hypothetical protein